MRSAPIVKPAFCTACTILPRCWIASGLIIASVRSLLASSRPQVKSSPYSVIFSWRE